MSAYRIAVLLLWSLAVLNSAIVRGLFWDGASFLATALNFRAFHDFYPEREHVAWLTQAPVLLLADLGVGNTRLLSIAYSASLFAWPAGLYHFALARVRGDAALTAAVVIALAAVYLPTSFFIIGEYNIAYAAAMAAMAVVLTGGAARRRDGAVLCALGALSIASYEAMIYLGPLLAAAILWALSRARRDGSLDDIAALLALVAASAFVAAAAVASVAIAEYWHYAYFTRVRAAAFDFWQNLQFVVPVAALAVLAVVSLARPSWLRGRGPTVVLGVAAALLLATPWLRHLAPQAMLFPPSHYVARTAAGWLMAAILVAMWLHVGWRRRPPRLLAELARPDVGRRLAGAATALLLAAAVPDLALSRLWVGYLDYFRGLVTGHTGIVRANDLPMGQWPQRLFAQDWTYPALSALLRSAPDQGVVVIDKDYRSNPPFDPSCGTVPKLEGFAWR
ncbi:hypothetical protein [Reyranella sp.]|uniref:hypothetical protein n=1 Tax=Reyranella sp. TaxID=1929291 RepID=UPI002F946111